MGALATWGLVTMSAVGLLSLAMARFDNEILTLIGYLIMIGLIVAGLWHVTNTISSTFFF
jgi:hypothetical protein